MAIFDQRQNLTFGSDLLRMVVALQNQQMQKERLEMEKDAFKLQQSKAKFEEEQRQGTLQQILGMQTPETPVSQGAAAQIADATQPAGPAIQQVARETATAALGGDDLNRAAVAAKFLDLPPTLPIETKREEKRDKSAKALDTLITAPELQLAMMAQEAGQPGIAQVMTERYFDANPTEQQRLAREAARLGNAQTRANIRLLEDEIRRGPLRDRMEMMGLKLRGAELGLAENRLALERELFPLKVETARVDLRSRQLDYRLNYTLFPTTVRSAQNQVNLQDLEIEDRQWVMTEREKAINGETEPQIALKTLLVDAEILDEASADAAVKGLTREGAARVMTELAISDSRTRDERLFTLFREFAMPKQDPVSGEWLAPAITDMEVLERVLSHIDGEPLPVDEAALVGVGTMYGLVAGGENPSDPAVLDAVTEDLVTGFNRLLVGGYDSKGKPLVGANQMTSAEKAALREAVKKASEEASLDEAYQAMRNYINSAKELEDFRRRIGLFRSARELHMLRQRTMQQGAAYAAARNATNNATPITLESLTAAPEE